jgi:hypothetical protein
MKKDELKQLITEMLNEALGVPTGLVSASTTLYNDFLKKLKSFNRGQTLGPSNKFTLNTGYSFADLEIVAVSITLNIQEHDGPIVFLGMAIEGKAQVTDKFKLQIRTSMGIPKIKINLAAPDSIVDKSEIIEFVEKEKNEILSSLTHELKHVYDDFKKPEEPLASRAKYASAQKIWLGEVQPLNKFLYNIYFIHAIENLVRPSEIAGRMATAGITKKEFYNFLTNDRVFKILKEIQNFTYEGLRNELLSYIPQIKEALDDNNISYGRTKQKIIDAVLNVVFISLTNQQTKIVKSLLSSDWSEYLEGFTGDKQKFFEKYISSIKKYGDNYEAFYKNEEKYFQKTATKVIKKISKLYDLAQDDEVQTESIINWKLWHELLGTPTKLKDKLDF